MKDILFINDVEYANADIAVGESNSQQQEFLLLAEKGSFKQSPAVGVGTMNFLESEDVSGLLNEIRKQFSMDGMTVKTVKISNGQIIVDANY